jgi:hypothetical protein
MEIDGVVGRAQQQGGGGGAMAEGLKRWVLVMIPTEKRAKGCVRLHAAARGNRLQLTKATPTRCRPL